MTVNKVEVFECPKCARLSRREEDITKCLAKHEADDIRDAQRTADLAKINVVKFHVVNNLRTRKAEDIGKLLSETATMIGFELKIKQISISQTYGSGGNQINIEGDFKRLYSDLNNRFNVKLSHELETLSRDSRPSFGDFVSFVAGIEANTSCYGQTFRATISIVPDQIPAVKELIDENNALIKRRTAWINRQSVLKKSYLSIRVPVLKISDIYYLNVEDMHRELTVQIAELTQTQKTLASQLAAREMELRQEDNEVLAIEPEPEYSYDAGRIEELGVLLGFKP